MATIVLPPGAAPPGGRPLLAYQPAEDTLTRDCASSYEIRQGTNGELPQALLPLLNDGVAVVVPDYEGPESQWTAGVQAGHAVLDSIRAAESFPPAGLGGEGTRVGIWGYSGGGQATAWASELQPTYAPELNVVGVAEGGVPAVLRKTHRPTSTAVPTRASCSPPRSGSAAPTPRWTSTASSTTRARR